MPSSVCSNAQIPQAIVRMLDVAMAEQADVVYAVRRARAGLSDPNRPIGSFIFLGPTGVGKTEVARTLAEFLFGDEDAMDHGERSLRPPC